MENVGSRARLAKEKIVGKMLFHQQLIIINVKANATLYIQIRRLVALIALKKS